MKIDKFFRRFLPTYTPSRALLVRSGREAKFSEAILWEGGLETLRPFITDMEKLARDLPSFLKTRGTLHAIQLGLSWVGIEKSRFVRLSTRSYEIDPGLEPSDLQIRAIREVLRLAGPGRGKLVRIFHGNFEVRYG